MAGLAVTPTGRERLAQLHPLTDAATGGGRAAGDDRRRPRFLADHPGFPLRAPSDLDEILEALRCRRTRARAAAPARPGRLSRVDRAVPRRRDQSSRRRFRSCARWSTAVASFSGEIADVRRKIDPSARWPTTPARRCAAFASGCGRQRAKLRTTLDSFLRGRDTVEVSAGAGRHRPQRPLRADGARRAPLRDPRIVHGGSASGASLFVEPLETVEINNDIVALEEQEAEEVRRILLALTDAFRGRPDDLTRTLDVATELDVIQARARFSQIVDGVEPMIVGRRQPSSCAARGIRC